MRRFQPFQVSYEEERFSAIQLHDKLKNFELEPTLFFKIYDPEAELVFLYIATHSYKTLRKQCTVLKANQIRKSHLFCVKAVGVIKMLF